MPIEHNSAINLQDDVDSDQSLLALERADPNDPLKWLKLKVSMIDLDDFEDEEFED